MLLPPWAGGRPARRGDRGTPGGGRDAWAEGARGGKEDGGRRGGLVRPTKGRGRRCPPGPTQHPFAPIILRRVAKVACTHTEIMSMHCTQCGAEGSGRFCGPCGASLVELPCPSCSADLPPGTRFCTECGSPLRSRDAGAHGPPTPAAGAGVAGGPGVLPWGIAGVLLTALLVVGGVSLLGGNGGTGGPAGPTAPAGALGPAPNIDLNTMTPADAAWRLFNRVAGALEQRDSVEVINFLPMALDAHEIARPLDDGQLFRYSFLLRVAMDYEGALQTAREGLERSPDHLLLLSAAAEAAREMGDDETARAYYTHLLDVWEEESASDLDDYQGHPRLIPVLRQEAEAYLDRS
ncbi:MAG: hypothetical protein EA350_11740 [Gemmatimonadales bacterium]|nr:MAG: hypothetical protein EA350_11740 [Gemmatimonadales bacterium]